MVSVMLVSAFLAFSFQGGVLARIPGVPGYPEGIAVDRGSVFVSTQARFGTANEGPSQILVFERWTGTLQGIIQVKWERLDAEHALSGITIDRRGDLYVLSTQLGVLRFTRSDFGWTQEQYAPPLPDLDGDGVEPLPNDAAFDDNGNLYISDSLQGVIWRIPPGGIPPQGSHEIWLRDPRLAPRGMAQLGVNGIRPDPDRQYMYMAISGGPAYAPGEVPTNGQILRIPLVERPNPETLERVFTYAPDAANGFHALPDGLAFTRHGLLYVVLAGANALSVLDVHGTEIDRITVPGNSKIPFVQPANLVFDRGSVLVTNHALYAENASDYFAVLEVRVHHRGDPLPRPLVPWGEGVGPCQGFWIRQPLECLPAAQPSPVSPHRHHPDGSPSPTR